MNPFSIPSLSLLSFAPPFLESETPSELFQKYRINIREAQIDAELIPRSFKYFTRPLFKRSALPSRWISSRETLEKIKTYEWASSGFEFHVAASEETALRSHLEIQDNAIPLQYKSLFEFIDLPIDGPWFFDLVPLKVEVGQNGVPYFKGQTHPEATFFTEILGYSLPLQDDSHFKLGLTSYLPAQFLNEKNRLPLSYPLPELLDHLQNSWRARSARPEKSLQQLLQKIMLAESEEPLGSLGDLVKSGALTLRLTSLEDLLIPGVADLSDSTATLNFWMDEDRGLHATLEDLELNLDPMGLLQGGSILGGDAAAPAVQLDYDPATQKLNASAHLDVSLDLLLGFLGVARLDAQVQWVGEVQRTGEMGWAIPDENTFVLQGSLKLPLEIDFNFNGELTLKSTKPTGDFSLALDFEIQSKGRPLLLDGRVEVSRKDGETWNFQLEAKHLEWKQISLNHVFAGLTLHHRQTGGIHRFSIPNFLLQANPLPAKAGWLRGLIRFELHPTPEGIFEATFDPKTLKLDFQNLLLGIFTQGIQLPGLLRRRQNQWRAEARRRGERLPPRIAGMGIDGHLAGNFKLNLSSLTGQGDLRLQGDSNGDLYFHDANFKKIGAPLFRSTRWRFLKISKIYLQRRYALGSFRLSTHLNTRILKYFGYPMDYETDWIMEHRDIPLSPGGIDRRNEDYYRKLFQEEKEGKL